ncbi:MAG: mechanosensitive ion channel family protein [Chitinophagaceae bacterium]|nr:MAG: mechanosensitive ion channel family protein [Chitinophagaceae bacterium]
MKFLQYKVLDNSVQSLLIAAGVIVLVLLFKKLLSHYFASLSYMLINRRWKLMDNKQFSVMFLRPLSWFLVITIGIITLSTLNYPAAWQFNIYKLPFEDILEKAAIALFIYSFIRLLFAVIDFISLILSHRAKLTQDKSDDQLVVFFRDFFKVILGIVGILLILKASFNQNIGNLLTGLSIVGAALALSARESLENLIASFIIFFDKPFYVGDTVKVNAVTGTVERIGLRSTRIRTADQTLVTVPNKQMVDSVVDNWSMRIKRRAEIKLELSEKTKAAQVQPLIDKVQQLLLQKQPTIATFTVFVSDYSKAGITLFIEYLTPPIPMADFNNLKQTVYLQLMELIEAEDIELATAGSNINIINPAEPEGSKSKPIL